MPSTKQTKENLNETFLIDLAGIFAIAGFKKAFFSHWTTIVPIFLSFGLTLISFCIKIEILNLLLEFKGQMLSFLPGILGFTIAGYSLMVGFIQAGMLNKITEPMKDSKFSLYQKMSASFAITILFQAFALILAYSVHLINYLDVHKEIALYIDIRIVILSNYFGLLLLSYWFFVSLFMVIQIVVNIFSFSQLHHYFVNKEKLEKDLSDNNT